MIQPSGMKQILLIIAVMEPSRQRVNFSKESQMRGDQSEA
jgi:hypothetical protein